MWKLLKCNHCKEYFEKWPELITAWSYKFCSKQHRLDFLRGISRKAKEKANLRQKKIRDKKANSVSVLTKKADKLASEYTRKRDSMITTWTLSHCICITCWEKKEYSQFDCWHFVTRANKWTRWVDENMNSQCKVCNNWWWWRQYEHWKAIDKKYWEWTADGLIAKWKQIFKLSSIYLQERIDYFTNKLKQYD